jgi:hypothetical protein
MQPYEIALIQQQLMICYISRGELPWSQTNFCIGTMSDSGQNCVQLSVREDGSGEVNADSIQIESLTAVECCAVGGCKRKLTKLSECESVVTIYI